MYFQTMANARKKKKIIPSLLADDSVAITQEDTQNVVVQHFMQHIGSYVPITCNLNFANVGWQLKSLMHLENPISEEDCTQSSLMHQTKRIQGLMVSLGFSSPCAGISVKRTYWQVWNTSSPRTNKIYIS
jgi:hypothetical protein